MRVRDLSRAGVQNDGTRGLFESILPPEVELAMRDWLSGTGGVGFVVIGGMALSYHARPRMTQDIDVLYRSESDVPGAVPGFTRTRPHAFQHAATHVEVEVLTTGFIRSRPGVVDAVFATASVVDGAAIASPSGLVALKLARHSMQDRADIVALIRTGRVDMVGFDLNETETSRLSALREAALEEH